MITITKNEWKFVMIVSVIVLLLVVVPFIFGYLVTPKEKTYLFTSGVYRFDMNVYFSYIEQAKAGQLLFKNLFTSEPQSVGFFNPLWLLVGIIARIFHLSSFLAFHLVRVLLIPVFLVIAYSFLAFFFQEESKRKLGLLFLIFASGWGFIVYDSIIKKGILTLDLHIAEAFAFPTLYFSPHLIASLGLMILIFLFSLQSFKFRTLKHSFLAGACALLLFSFHPYHVPTIFGVLFVFTVYIFIRDKKIDLHYIRHFFIVALSSLPPIAYQVWLFLRMPVTYGHFFLLPVLTPPLHILFFSYGLMIPLSLIGIFVIVKKGKISLEESFLIIWFFTQFALLYVPLNNQRRLTEGWSLVIAVLVTCGILHLKNSAYMKNFTGKHFTQEGSIGKFINRAGLLGMFIILFSTSNLIIVVNHLYYVTRSEVPGSLFDGAAAYYQNFFYISNDTKEAMMWLRNTPEDSIILSSYDNGGLIPAFATRGVYLGHRSETVDFIKKQKEVEWFFRITTERERAAFLKTRKIDYIFLAPQERRKITFNPENDRFLKNVYQNESVAIYQIIP